MEALHGMDGGELPHITDGAGISSAQQVAEVEALQRGSQGFGVPGQQGGPAATSEGPTYTIPGPDGGTSPVPVLVSPPQVEGPGQGRSLIHTVVMVATVVSAVTGAVWLGAWLSRRS